MESFDYTTFAIENYENELIIIKEENKKLKEENVKLKERNEFLKKKQVEEKFNQIHYYLTY